VTAQLSLCALLSNLPLPDSLSRELAGDRYIITSIRDVDVFLAFVKQNQHQLDGLIIPDRPEIASLYRQLVAQRLLFPAVILETADGEEGSSERWVYHPAEVRVRVDRLHEIASAIDRAIARFLELSPKDSLTQTSIFAESTLESAVASSLSLQQRRLADKLKERLGYLGIYYKRDPKMFVRNLSEPERKQFLHRLKAGYRDVVLNYFSEGVETNSQIDELVALAFFADIPVTAIVEIHMELMDEFAEQLKLEGRSEEILLDYRLTLIDVIAHLCEMYRRSIPRDS
jgi:circadian clock protein KaiA